MLKLTYCDEHRVRGREETVTIAEARRVIVLHGGRFYLNHTEYPLHHLTWAAVARVETAYANLRTGKYAGWKLEIVAAGDTKSMTRSEMALLRPSRKWSDGRVGYEWCRFDAVLDKRRYLRAEVTWDDDSEETGGEPTLFYSPQLFLETNTPVEAERRWQTLDGVVIDLTQEEAVLIVSRPPEELLKTYADKLSQLTYHQEKADG
jgi:hypothetical protein